MPSVVYVSYDAGKWLECFESEYSCVYWNLPARVWVCACVITWVQALPMLCDMSFGLNLMLLTLVMGTVFTREPARNILLV